MQAKIAKVKKTKINGILTNPSKPSVKLVALVEPIIINKIIKK